MSRRNPTVEGGKFCNKCQTFRPLEEFHNSKNAYDGKCSACKPCTCARARKHRDDNIERARAHDRERARTPERKAADAERLKEKRKNKLWDAAHTAVDRAVRSGRLTRLPCEVCGDPHTEGHHDDYEKPLDVRWLCKKHHDEHHFRIARAEALAREEEMRKRKLSE